MRLPSRAIDELAEIGRDLLPDAPEGNTHGIYPANAELPPNPPGPEILVDDDEATSTPEPNLSPSSKPTSCFFFYF